MVAVTVEDSERKGIDIYHFSRSVMVEYMPITRLFRAEVLKKFLKGYVLLQIPQSLGTKGPSKVFPRIIKPLSASGEVDAAIRHLRAADHLLTTLIDTHAPPALDTHAPPFLSLTKSILYQQLAYKAGTSIYKRFTGLCGCEDAVKPDAVLSLSSEQLKKIGVSGRKASYLHDLSNKYKNGMLSDESVIKMDDRPDVLPVSDLGVRKGVQILYGLEELQLLEPINGIANLGRNSSEKKEEEKGEEEEKRKEKKRKKEKENGKRLKCPFHCT
ncbi:hypothetical protein LguiA_004647 [Lonicera macranthoides]